MSFKKLTSCKSVFYYTREDKVPIRVTVSELLRDPMTDIRDLILDIYNNKEIELNCVITLKEDQKEPKYKSKQQKAPKIKQVQLKDENLTSDSLSVIFKEPAECKEENFGELCWSGEDGNIRIMPNTTLSFNPFTFQHKEKIMQDIINVKKEEKKEREEKEEKKEKKFSSLYGAPFILFYKYENCDVLKNNWIMLYDTIKNYYYEIYELEVNEEEYYVESRVFKGYNKNEIYIYFFLKDKRFHSNYISYIENYRSIDLRKLVLKQEYHEKNKIENDCDDFLYMREQSGGNKNILDGINKEDIKIISEYYKANTEHTNCAIYLLVEINDKINDEINNKFYEISLMSITADFQIRNKTEELYIEKVMDIIRNQERVIDNGETKYYFGKLPAKIDLYVNEIKPVKEKIKKEIENEEKEIIQIEEEVEVNKMPYYYAYKETAEDYFKEGGVLDKIIDKSKISPGILINLIIASELRKIFNKYKDHITVKTLHYYLLHPDAELKNKLLQQRLNNDENFNKLKIIIELIKELKFFDTDIYDVFDITENYVRFSKSFYYNIKAYSYIIDEQEIKYDNEILTGKEIIKKLIQKEKNYYNREIDIDKIFDIKHEIEGIKERSKNDTLYNLLITLSNNYLIFYSPNLDIYYDKLTNFLNECKIAIDNFFDEKKIKYDNYETIQNNRTNYTDIIKIMNNLLLKINISNYDKLFKQKNIFVYNFRHLKYSDIQEINSLVKNVKQNTLTYINYPNELINNLMHVHVFTQSQKITPSEAFMKTYYDMTITRSIYFETEIVPYIKQNNNIIDAENKLRNLDLTFFVQLFVDINSFNNFEILRKEVNKGLIYAKNRYAQTFIDI